jgi:hypothetical protein
MMTKNLSIGGLVSDVNMLPEPSKSLKRADNAGKIPNYLAEIPDGPNENFNIDQSILDEIGEASSDSDSDSLPPPAFFAAKSLSLSRSRSMGCLKVLSDVEDFEQNNTLLPSPKRFMLDSHLQEPPSKKREMRRVVSMPCMENNRCDYNRAMGSVIASSPKKPAIDIARDLSIMEELLADL